MLKPCRAKSSSHTQKTLNPAPPNPKLLKQPLSPMPPMPLRALALGLRFRVSGSVVEGCGSDVLGFRSTSVRQG